MDAKLDQLRAILRSYERVLVAYSGGVDSTFLLRVAADELGSRVIALTVESPTAAEEEFGDAGRLAASFGVEHVVVRSNELEIPGYADNPPNRCFFCKDNLYTICEAVAGERGIAVIADGANLDDLSDYRPGLSAAHEREIAHPLVDAGLRKEEIRSLSRSLGLPTWDKPASPCLSSRFPYGTTITLERLSQVARAEQALHRLGFRTCRVRYHEHIARIEVPLHDLPRALSEGVREEIIQALKTVGFAYVTIDLQGLRSGSLNELLHRTAAPTQPTRDPTAS
jgi:uncharacterized protein